MLLCIMVLHISISISLSYGTSLDRNAQIMTMMNILVMSLLNTRFILISLGISKI